MATKKKTTKTVPVKAEVKPPPPSQWVENGSGHQCVWERVTGVGYGETIDFCAVCAATRPV